MKKQRKAASCRYKYEGGRAISRDGKPFIYIQRVEGQHQASPVEVDDAARKIARLLCKR
jgi:hypothetical protein